MPLRTVLAASVVLLLLAGCGGNAPPAAPGARPAPDATDTAPAAGEAPADAGAGENGAGAAGGTGEGEGEGAEYPVLVVTTLDGGAYDLADRRGRWVVVNFWATWCAPCIKEMPELSALDAMNEHVEVIGLAYEDTDPDALRQFLQERPVVYPVAQVDVYDPPRDFPTPRGLPLTCLVGPDGRLVQTFLGPVTAADLERAIQAAGGPSPAAAG